MPTSSGEYLGDRAGVLPSNTAALIHFSDQFAQMAAQRRAQKAAQQREDEQMRARVNAGINSQIYNPNFLKTDASNPQLFGMMSNASNDILETLKTQGPEAAYQKTHDWASKISEGSQALKQAHAAVLAQAATYAKNNPGINQDDLYKALLHKMFFTDNPDGTSKEKDLTEINPYQNSLADVLKSNGQDFYSEQSAYDALEKDTKALETDVTEPSNIDNKGNIISRGYTAKKIPLKAIDIIPDDKGGFTTRLKGVDYSLDGKTPYVDQNGQTVKVLTPELQKYYGDNNAIAAKVERMTRQQLSDVNAAGQQIDRDSPYAEMLYQKNLYDFVNSRKLNGGYAVSPDDAAKQSRAIKDKLFTQGMQQAHLDISKRNSEMSGERLQMAKGKQSLTDANGKAISSRFEKLVNDANEVEIPLTGQKVKYVDVGNMDRDEYNQLAGSKAKTTTDTFGNTTTTYGSGIAPYEIDGKKVLIVNEKTGNLEGKDGTITKDAADSRQIDALPKGKLKTTVMQKAKDAVKKVIKKVKGTDKKMY